MILGLETIDIVQIVLTSGVLFYAGRIDQKIRFLCRGERDHETRLRALEQPEPKSPTPVRAVLRRIDGHDA